MDKTSSKAVETATFSSLLQAEQARLLTGTASANFALAGLKKQFVNASFIVGSLLDTLTRP